MSKLSELAAEGAAIVERQERLLTEIAERIAADMEAMGDLQWLCNQVASIESSQLCNFTTANLQLIHFAANISLTRLMQEAINFAADKERNCDNG